MTNNNTQYDIGRGIGLAGAAIAAGIATVSYPHPPYGWAGGFAVMLLLAVGVYEITQAWLDVPVSDEEGLNRDV